MNSVVCISAALKNRELDGAVHARLRRRPARYPSLCSHSPLPSSRLPPRTEGHPQQDTNKAAAGFRLSSACPCPSATQSAKCLSDANSKESLTTFAFYVVRFSFFHMGPFCLCGLPCTSAVLVCLPPHCVFLMGTRTSNAHAAGNGSTDHPNSFFTFQRRRFLIHVLFVCGLA